MKGSRRKPTRDGPPAWALGIGPTTLHNKNNFVRKCYKKIRDEFIGSWIKLHNEELHNLYSSPDIIRIIMSRRM
jgi:hypothetical protein